MDKSNRALLWAPMGHSFLPTFLYILLAMTVAAGSLPLLESVCNPGWLAPVILSVVLFFVFFLIKILIFNHKDAHASGNEDSALLEYLVQQNTTGAPREEEVEMELLENALHLRKVRAQDCMAPRPEIVHVDVSASVETLRQIFIESSFSRILVTQGDLDSVLGYVHVQQMFIQPRNIRSLVMPITFVPESIAVNDLLSKFVKNRTNIACVVDEYGSLSGLVTLEDVLEQLFGNIDDEHDQEEFIDVQISDREFLFSGRLKIDYLNEKYASLSLPSGDYQTLSGYLVMTMQTIPEQGARIELQGKVFILELVSDRKIETVRVLVGG